MYLNHLECNAMTVNTTDYPLDTEPFADLNGIKPQSVRARVCRFGDYFGIKPLKLANGRLKWPRIQVTPQRKAG